jgi:hypothetical protein
MTVHRALASGSAAMGAIINEPRCTRPAEIVLTHRINDLDKFADTIADFIENREPASAHEWQTWGRFVGARLADAEQWKEAQEALAQVQHGMVDAAA